MPGSYGNKGKYGLIWFNDRLKEVGYKCEDCGRGAPEDYWRYDRRQYPLVMDHDHKYKPTNSKSWRKILCRSCNNKPPNLHVSDRDLMLNGH